MADADRQRWDERYSNAPDDTVRPTAPERLGPVLDHVPSTGRALDVACGTGAQSLWAAERGLSVTSLDVSPVAVDRLRTAADAAGLARRVDARVADLDAGLPDDLAGSPGEFDLVLVQRFRAPHLDAQLVDRLAPGGVLVVSVLSEVGATGDVGPFHAPPGDLDARFGRFGLEELLAEEADGLATIVLRRTVVR